MSGCWACRNNELWVVNCSFTIHFSLFTTIYHGTRQRGGTRASFKPIIWLDGAILALLPETNRPIKLDLCQTLCYRFDLGRGGGGSWRLQVKTLYYTGFRAMIIQISQWVNCHFRMVQTRGAECGIALWVIAVLNKIGSGSTFAGIFLILFLGSRSPQ